MRMTGSKLAEVLKFQGGTVEVRDAQSFRLGAITVDQALHLAESGRYVGIGNRRRVLFIRPELRPSAIGWKGSNRTQTQRIRNHRGEIIAPDFALEFKPLVWGKLK